MGTLALAPARDCHDYERVLAVAESRDEAYPDLDVLAEFGWPHRKLSIRPQIVRGSIDRC
jgi:hypothetical protein